MEPDPPAPPTGTWIAGVDPATHKTGVALIWQPLRGEPRVHLCTVVKGGTGDALVRVRRTSYHVYHQIKAIWREQEGLAEARPQGILLGIEEPYTRTGRQRGVTDQLPGLELVWMAYGALASLPMWGEVFSIQPASVKTVFGAGHMRREGAKASAVEWARRVFGQDLKDDEDDAADALAAAVWVGDRWRQRTLAAAQGVLPLKGRG